MTNAADANSAPRIALQLYNLRRQAEVDLEATLDLTREAGYRELEWFGGTRGLTPDALRRLLDDRGLSLVAAHVPLETLETETGRLMETYRALGCDLLVCPWLRPELRGDGSVRHYRSLGARLDVLSYRLRAGDFRLGYHNHEFELAAERDDLGLTTGLYALASSRSHDGWGLELDVYWTAFAGFDPVALIREFDHHIRALHLKDGLLPGQAARRTPEEATRKRWFRPLGDGQVDIAGAVEAGLAVGVRLFVVEQDETATADGSPEGDAARSLRFLMKETALADGSEG